MEVVLAETAGPQNACMTNCDLKTPQALDVTR